MKTLQFTYSMELLFDAPVRKHRFTLKCVPQTSARQEIAELHTEVYPKEFLSTDEDSFGNACIYGFAQGEHDRFSVEVRGTARTGLAESEPAGEDYQVGLYKYQTPYTKPGAAIRALAKRVPPAPGAGALQKALAFMEALRGAFQYRQGVTSIATTAEEAMAGGAGVCQDYAHILLSLCRMEGVPCRYVVGMLLGEGLSHAWVEVCDRGRWIALDPTNGVVVSDQHIKISSGRDYQDCTINQGVFTGLTRQTQTIRVIVNEI